MQINLYSVHLRLSFERDEFVQTETKPLCHENFAHYKKIYDVALSDKPICIAGLMSLKMCCYVNRLCSNNVRFE